MTTAEIIAFVGVGISMISMIVAVVTLAIKTRRDGRTDVAGNAARDARIDAKLDSIDNGVSDMRVEVRTMREKQNEQAEKLAVLESSIKSAHHRIDRIEGGKPND